MTAIFGYTKGRYFSLLSETTDAVIRTVDNLVYSDIDDCLRGDLSKDMEIGLGRRRKGKLLRPFLTRMCYELSGGEEWKEILRLMAAVELLNISTYQSNYCFDDKAGVSDSSEKNNQFICSMLTISKAISAVNSIDTLPDGAKVEIADILARSNHEVYLGQFMDLNILTMDRVDHFSDLEAFLSSYLARCNLIAGSTFRACATGAVATNSPRDVIESLLGYLGALGAAAQAINDLGDYIPCVTKDYAVPFSDFHLGRLTLPAYLLIQAGIPVQEWRESIENRESVKEIESGLIEAILDLNIEATVRRLVKEKFFPIIKSKLAILEGLVGPEKAAPLRFAYPYIYDSRMLRYFRKDANRAW